MQVFFVWEVIILILVVWLIVVSLVLYQIFALFKKLTKDVEAGDLTKVLEKVLDQESLNKKEIGGIIRRLDLIEDDAKLHIQKIGLVRFNPFKEVGGDHSFSLAVLDRFDSGVVITSLHTRDRTRVYMKGIEKGKGDMELSEEEKKAIAKAK